MKPSLRTSLEDAGSLGLDDLVIRLPLKWARPLLNDETLDIQIIYLVRDPRAVMMSRLKYPWWCQDKSCSDTETVCDILKENLKVADELQEMFPGKFKVYQYERINKNPNRGLREIMTFLNLPVSQAQLDTLKPNITEQDNFYGIRKNATAMVDEWRSQNPFEIIRYIQETCAEVISKQGLRFFDSESELRNLSLPLIVSDAS
ncbi:carbohydrate sulfotransferase 1-like [Palaemon carinicauda]|uniref:carbohydrate sulfotransferase 1-like n=1 Tax=Palaemon carinicauda TaxID=392227 RepID=UPI0035B680E6